MTTGALRRLFWRGAAGLLVLAALVALSALVGRGFDETDGKIMATLGVALLAGGAGVVGLALREQKKSEPLSAGILGVVPLCFLVLAAYIWRGFEGDGMGRWAGTALVVLVSACLLGSSLLMLRDRAYVRIVLAEAGALGLALVTTTALIWSHDAADGTAKLAAACWILAVLGWVLVPVLQRSSAPTLGGPAAGDERVLASLADVDLVITSQPRQDDLVVSGVSHLASGESVALRLRRT
jgi:hypothetical protein